MPKRAAEPRVDDAAGLFAALGDPTRLALLQRLSEEGPASIAALAGSQRITRQGVTKHLHVLESAGLIGGRRQGREHVWTLKASRLAQGRRYLEIVTREWDAALSRLKAHAERAT